MDTNFSFNATTNTPDTPVTLTLMVNGDIIKSAVIDKLTSFEYVLADEPILEYNIEIIMSGKTDAHTTLDDHGLVLESTVINLENLKFDKLALDNFFLEGFATYHHDTNGTTESQKEVYCSLLGCNGSIKFTVETPIYQWLLNYV